jgi:hypothetical protein
MWNLNGTKIKIRIIGTGCWREGRIKYEEQY